LAIALPLDGGPSDTYEKNYRMDLSRIVQSLPCVLEAYTKKKKGLRMCNYFFLKTKA